jgi:hypothetical protein
MANGWDIGSKTQLFYNSAINRDEVIFHITAGSNGYRSKSLPTIYLDPQGNWRSDNELMQRLLDEE